MSQLPPKPALSPPPESPVASGWLSIFLAATVGSAAFVTLTFLTLGFFGPLALVVAGVFAFIGLNYLVWGWWLKRLLPQVEREDLQEHDDADEL